MSAALEARAEVAKLARLLGVDSASLDYLEAVPAEDLRRFRDQATDSLFDADRHVLQRVAAASRRLPTQLVATIGQHAIGPLLCARVTGLLEPGRAVDVAARLPDEFLTDIAVEMDPRRASDVIAAMPTDRVVEVARRLHEREEFVAMGRFVGHMSDEAIEACLDVIDDGALLRIAFVLEGKERLDRIVDLLPEGRLEGVIAAADEEDLWPEALDLVGHLGEARREEVAELTASQDDEVLDALVRAAHEESLWSALLPLIRLRSDGMRKRFASLASIQDDGVLEAVVHAAAEDGLWAELLPLVPLLPKKTQRRAAAHVAELKPAVRGRAAKAAGKIDGLGPVGEALEA